MITNDFRTRKLRIVNKNYSNLSETGSNKRRFSIAIRGIYNNFDSLWTETMKIISLVVFEASCCVSNPGILNNSSYRHRDKFRIIVFSCVFSSSSSPSRLCFVKPSNQEYPVRVFVWPPAAAARFPHTFADRLHVNRTDNWKLTVNEPERTTADGTNKLAQNNSVIRNK
ncbi:hypothetical protein HUJ05_010568 [Dendroctonus ponderosae]|nr:hypothetical protein HUJ05_010568 [Dendroctonus ponderosae]